MPDEDDKTVKELIDAATRAELEKWFGLPSFQQLAEKPAEPEPESPEWAAFRKRRAEALAAIDPGLLEAHRRRVERQRDLKLFQADLEVRVSPDILMLDQAMIDHGHTIAEPREYELPVEIRDALSESTPQALLRDLHRPELTFDKTFEMVDAAAEYRVDVHDIVAEALRFRPSSMTGSKVREARQLVLEARKETRKPWAELKLTVKMPNRRVTE